MSDFILKKRYAVCVCCMEKHTIKTVKTTEMNVYKGTSVSYEAIYDYCDKADEYFESGDMITRNYIAMKKAYEAISNVKLGC